MRYLKRFNEELKASTYKSAGEKFTKMGHKRRGSELLDYAGQVELKEKYQKLIDAQNENKEFGLFDITLKKGKRDIFSGKFYLHMCLEVDWFKDLRYEWLYDGMNYSLGFSMEFALIPSDDETFKMIETSADEDIEYFRKYSMWGDYKYWTNRLWITFFEKDMKPAFRAGVNGFEDRDGVEFIFNSRSDAMRFKKLLADALEGKSNWGSWMVYRSGWMAKTIAEQFKEGIILNEEQWRKLLMDIYLKDREEDEYDLTDNPFTEDIHMKVVESIKRMSINPFYRD
jgi:hypothetical protein